MAYKVKTEGMDEISRILRELGDQAESAAAEGLYDGAGIMAKGIKAEAKRVKTSKFHYTVHGMRDPSPEEIEAVQNGIGIAKFEKTGSEVNTSVGYSPNAGYVEIAGKKKPIALIANSINSGTSFMPKKPYVRLARNKYSKPASAAIADKIEKRLDAITKEKSK